MDEFALTFKNITRSDTGQYVCVGRNQEGGSTSSPYNLQVMCKSFVFNLCLGSLAPTLCQCLPPL